MSEPKDPKVRQASILVGAAIKGVVESGADDEFIGEFAASYLHRVAAVLGQPADALRPPDLREIVAEAVKSALESGGPPRPRSLAPAAKAVRIGVVIDGRRTSVTIARATFRELLESKGGNRPAATEVVEDLASRVPRDAENRSGWIEERLRAILSASDGVDTSGARH